MKPKEFFDAVALMRAKQKLYFKTRTTAALQESKKLEALVDAEIDRVNKIINERSNPSLF